MRSMTRSRQLLGLLAWLATAFTGAGIGAAASASAGSFYQQLARPDWAPPGWLFAPVWSVLYLSMALAAWLVWRVGGFRASAAALSLFLVQLAANALWTWLYFQFHLGALAFADIVLLDMLIIATTMAFARIRTLAAWLMLPYLAWVLFATALSFSTWQRNPGLL